MMSPLNRAKVDVLLKARGRSVGTVYKRTRMENGRKVQRAEVRFDDGWLPSNSWWRIELTGDCRDRQGQAAIAPDRRARDRATSDRHHPCDPPCQNPTTWPLTFSAEARAVLDAGRALWTRFHAIDFPLAIRDEFKLGRSDASWYQVRRALKARGDTELIDFTAFDAAYAALGARLRPMVYDLGFLPR